MTAKLTPARRKAFVRSLGRTIERIARRRRHGWLEAREWLQARVGLDLRGWHHLSGGRLESVPGVALERLELCRRNLDGAP